MPNSPNKKNYNANYAKNKAAADTAGEKVNSYIKRAVDERMERESPSQA